MADEKTLEEVHGAVEELRREIKKAVPDQEKLDRIDAMLDSQEEKNQKLVLAEETAKGAVAEVKELKALLEQKGVEAGEIRTQVEALELEIAKRSTPVETSYRDGEEFKALQEWCIHGERLPVEQKATLRTDSATAGGFLVPVEMDTVIVKKITEIDPIRSVARVRTIAAKSMEMPIRNTIPTATYEGEAETGADSESTYQSESVVPYRQTFTTPITQDMLQDAAFDMEAEITSDAGEAFAFGEGNGFVVGTGFKQPAGFTANATLQAAARATGVSADIAPENLIDLTGDLKEGYDPVFVFNRRTLARIRKFRADAVSAADSAGPFLWAPGFQDVGAAGPQRNTINGFPYILANSMPDLASNAYSVAFGDFRRGYTIVDRTGMSIIRDDLTQKKLAIVEFTMNRWNTGKVVLTEPIKLLKCGA